MDLCKISVVRKKRQDGEQSEMTCLEHQINKPRPDKRTEGLERPRGTFDGGTQPLMSCPHIGNENKCRLRLDYAPSVGC